jgi:hypothetical protein
MILFSPMALLDLQESGEYQSYLNPFHYILKWVITSLIRSVNENLFLNFQSQCLKGYPLRSSSPDWNRMALRRRVIDNKVAATFKDGILSVVIVAASCYMVLNDSLIYLYGSLLYITN